LGRDVRADDDSVVLFHAASLDGARFLLTEQILAARDSRDGVYVSTSPAILSLKGQWEVIVPVRVSIEDLELSADERENVDPEIRRADFRLKIDEDGHYRPLGVGRAAYDAFGVPGEPMPPDWDI